MKTIDCFTQIKNGMALAFFANAYAEQAEDWGLPMRGEIMDQLPDAIDKAALHAADTLINDLISAHEYGERALSSAQAVALLYVKASQCDRNDADRELSPELFGHYLAMQAMGTGVGLESFGSEVRDAIEVPYLEFSSASLELDYFEDEAAE